MSNTSLSRRLERLVRGGSALTAEVSLDRVMQSVADLAREVIGAKYAALGLLAPDRRTLQLFVTSGISAEARAALGTPPRGHGILGLVIREGRTIRLPDLRHAPRFGRISAGTSSDGLLPRCADHRTDRGARQSLSHGEGWGAGPSHDEDEHLAVLLASMAAAAMENARSHEESARLLGDVQALMRSRERFFAMVNHELRNALAGVLGWAELLVRRRDPATVPRAAHEVLGAAESAAELIGDLLDLSRLDEDRLKPVLTPVDSRSVIHRSVARVTPMAETRELRIMQTIGPGPARADHGRQPRGADPGEPAQQCGPPLATWRRASTSWPRSGGGRFVVDVMDQGPGVAADQLPHVFDVYYTKPGPDGMGVGLGLPLARRLALLLHGDLLAGNRPTGGAVFTLELPLDAT